MFPFGKRSISQRRDRDQRAKRRTEQKAKENQNRLSRQESQSESSPEETQQTSNSLLRGNTLPAYLDLAETEIVGGFKPLSSKQQYSGFKPLSRTGSEEDIEKGLHS